MNRTIFLAALLSLPLVLAACGGGGGGGSSASGAPATTVTASATTADVNAPRTGAPPADVFITLTADRLPPDGLGSDLKHTTNGIASVSLIDDDTSARIRISWLNPGSKPIGGYEDEIRLRLCYDDPCTREVNGSPIIVRTHYSVEESGVLASGAEYRARGTNVTAVDMAWSPVNNRIYAAVPSAFSVAVIDPATGKVERMANLGGVPRLLAASDDGQFLFVSRAQGIVGRYRLPALTLEETYILASDKTILDLAVAPGRPDTVAISAVDEGGFNAISVYNDAGFLTLFSGVGEGPGPIAWNDDGVTIYAKGADAGTTLYSKTITSPPDSTLMTAFAAAFVRSGGEISFGAGRVVDDFSLVVDASTGALEGSLRSGLDPVRTVVDGPQMRAFVADESIGSRVTSYALDTRAQIDSIEIPIPDSSSGGDAPTDQIIRWGEDGLAVSVAGRVLLIDGTFVTPAP